MRHALSRIDTFAAAATDHEADPGGLYNVGQAFDLLRSDIAGELDRGTVHARLRASGNDPLSKEAQNNAIGHENGTRSDPRQVLAHLRERASTLQVTPWCAEYPNSMHDPSSAFSVWIVAQRYGRMQQSLNRGTRPPVRRCKHTCSADRPSRLSPLPPQLALSTGAASRCDRPAAASNTDASTDESAIWLARMKTSRTLSPAPFCALSSSLVSPCASKSAW